MQPRSWSRSARCHRTRSGGAGGRLQRAEHSTLGVGDEPRAVVRAREARGAARVVYCRAIIGFHARRRLLRPGAGARAGGAPSPSSGADQYSAAASATARAITDQTGRASERADAQALGGRSPKQTRGPLLPPASPLPLSERARVARRLWAQRPTPKKMSAFLDTRHSPRAVTSLSAADWLCVVRSVPPDESLTPSSRRAHPRGGFHCACRRTRSLSVQIPDRASFVDRSSAKPAGAALRRGGTSLKQPARDRSALPLQRDCATCRRCGFGQRMRVCVCVAACAAPASARAVRLDVRPDAFAVWMLRQTLDTTKTSRRGRSGPIRSDRAPGCCRGSSAARTDVGRRVNGCRALERGTDVMLPPSVSCARCDRLGSASKAAEDSRREPLATTHFAARMRAHSALTWLIARAVSAHAPTVSISCSPPGPRVDEKSVDESARPGELLPSTISQRRRLDGNHLERGGAGATACARGRTRRAVLYAAREALG